MQGVSVPFNLSSGEIKYVFIGSKKTIETPNSWKSTVLDNLVQRRMFKVRIVEDPPPKVVSPTPPGKKIVKPAKVRNQNKVESN